MHDKGLLAAMVSNINIFLLTIFFLAKCYLTCIKIFLLIIFFLAKCYLTCRCATSTTPLGFPLTWSECNSNCN